MFVPRFVKMVEPAPTNLVDVCVVGIGKATHVPHVRIKSNIIIETPDFPDVVHLSFSPETRPNNGFLVYTVPHTDCQ